MSFKTMELVKNWNEDYKKDLSNYIISDVQTIIKEYANNYEYICVKEEKSYTLADGEWRMKIYMLTNMKLELLKINLYRNYNNPWFYYLIYLIYKTISVLMS